MNRDFYRWALPAWLWGLFIVIMTSLPRIEIPKTGLTFTDKILHAGVYGIFALLVARARIKADLSRLNSALLWTVGFCTLFAVLDELHQIFIPNRFGDVADGLADVFGVLLAIAFIKWIIIPISKKWSRRPL